MICRRCLQRAAALSSRIPKSSLPARIRKSNGIITNHSSSSTITTTTRPFSNTATPQSSSPAPSPPSPGPENSSSGSPTAPPVFSTPLADTPAGQEGSRLSLSSCPEGTVLAGLNYFKNRTDPVALADDAYPSWLWRCLEVQEKRKDDEAADDAGDEFSKSKKQRRLAAKRQRATEARLLAEGNIEALAPRIPLQQQSVNLPANEEGTAEGALAAQDTREELRRAMRKERKARIKESNYLKSM